MARKQNDAKFWDESLKMISFCPVCETNYNPMEAQIVGQRDNSHLLHITCRKCLNSIIALVFISKSGISSVGLVTDLTFADVVKFKGSEEIDVDDVLDIHGALEDESHFWKTLRF